jgi:anti-sigma B factor antagonist
MRMNDRAPRTSSAVPPVFRCSVEPDRDRVRLRLAGELDVQTVGEVQERLEQLRDAGFEHIVLDLSDLSFMDSTGLHLALRWARKSERDGFSFGVTGASPPVLRLLHLTGTTHLVA